MLDVLLNDSHIARLEQTRKGARLIYDEPIAEAMQGQAVLSTALTAKKRPYSEGLTGSWFENLLPEGDRLERLCRTLNCSPTDYMTILGVIGWECAGAVSVVPEGYVSSDEEDSSFLSSEELAVILNDLPMYETEEAFAMRTSLGGFQEKLLVTARDVRVSKGRIKKASIGLPNGSEITTHILKPQLAAKYPHLIEAEAWAMEVARHAALCANGALLHIEGAPLTLMVERFDRVPGDKGLSRLHQEDCCQAMGLPPANKYVSVKDEKGTDPSYRKIAKLLLAFSPDFKQEAQELLRQITVNWVLGNTDAHAKNYAFLYKEIGKPSLSPMYDVTPSLDIEPQAKSLSMRIAGKIESAEIERQDMIEEALSWGMDIDTTVTTLDETLIRLEEGLDEARKIYPEAAALFETPAMQRLDSLR